MRRHDIATEPIDEGQFDLAHARLVLEHLPRREEALGRLARSLRPGGRLVVEAVAYISGIPVSDIGAEEHARFQGVRLERMRAAGLDPEYGRRLPAAFRSLGLTDVGTEGRVWVMEGGSAAARWFRLSMEQLRGSLTGQDGLTEAEVDRMLQLFDDPDWAAMTPIIMAAWGRRPLADR